MSKEERQKLIQEIETKRNSHLIVYIAGDRPNSVATIAQDVVREIYNLMLEVGPLDKKKIDIFLYSRGGDSTVPWQLVSMIREHVDEFNVIIPYRAHSAATMIALGADEIVMGAKGELSPIDVTISGGPHNPKDSDTKEKLPVSVEDVKGFFSLLDQFGKVPGERAIDGCLKLMDKVPPLILGNVHRTLEQTKLVAARLLGSRREPFDKEKNEKIAEKLSSEIFSHMHMISRKEATEEIGLTQVKPAGALEQTLWHLLSLYEKELKIYEPFLPEDELENSDVEEKLFPNHKLIYLETIKRTRVFKLDVKMKKVRQYPAQINFNPQIQLPPLQIPPQLATNQQALIDFIQNWLQGGLPGILNACLDSFKKDFPVIGYDRKHLNKKWVDE